MEFPYAPSEGSRGPVTHRPYLPVTFRCGDKRFPTGALVDTGSDFTILPLEVAHVLEVELDDSKTLVVASAGGGSFRALPSRRPIGHTLGREGYRPIHWEGTAYFAEGEDMILLVHYQCLERFDLTFHGPERMLSVLPRFHA